MGKRDHLEAAVVLLEEMGFAMVGEIHVGHVRISSTKPPLYGDLESDRCQLGGRLRMVLLGTGLRVTLGTRTACIYRADASDGDLSDMENVGTHDLAALRDAIAMRTWEKPRSVTRPTTISRCD